MCAHYVNASVECYFSDDGHVSVFGAKIVVWQPGYNGAVLHNSNESICAY